MSTIDGGSGGVAVLDEPPAPGPAPEEGRRKRLLVILAIIAALVVLVAGVFAWYLITRKPLSELPVLGSEAMPTYQYSIYGVDKPLGVAVSQDGDRVYVTQSGGKRAVLEFDHSGHLLKTLQAPKSATGHLPMYVAVSPTDGSVVVSDRMADTLYVYSADGTYQRTLKPGNLSGTWEPLGVAFAPDGTLYVTEVGGKQHRVLAIDQFGAVTRTLTTTDPALSFPNGVTVAKNGLVLVTDSNNGRLVAFDQDGTVVGGAARGIGEGDLGLPRGIAADGGDRVYVVDTVNQWVHVYRIGDDGTSRVSFLGSFGDEGIADGLFEYPNGIAIDGRSDIYVTDRENGRVQVWS